MEITIERLTLIAKRIENLLVQPLTEPQHFYYTAFYFLIFGILSPGISIFFSLFLLCISLVLFCWGYAIDTYHFIKKIWESDFNKKALGAISGIIITLPSYIMANQTINQVTSVSPNNLDSSVAVISLMLIPKVTLIAGMGIFFAATIWQFIYTMKMFTSEYTKWFASIILFKEHKIENHEKEAMVFPRIVGGITLIVILGFLSEKYEENKLNLYPFFESIIVYSDYYEKHSCIGIKANSRIAFLKDGRISIATKDYLHNWSFKTGKCVTS